LSELVLLLPNTDNLQLTKIFKLLKAVSI
jgi:hypothetical protein